MQLGARDFLSLSREFLARGCQMRFEVQGSSMLPSIRSGNVLRVEPVDLPSLRRGDIIFYHTQERRLVAHRLVRMRPVHGRMMLFTRGDAHPWKAVDQVEPAQVLGRVVAVDWGQGLRIRTAAGPGRFLGILLSQISPLMQWAYPPLSQLKGKLRQLWPSG